MNVQVAEIIPTKHGNHLVKFTSSSSIAGLGDVSNGTYYLFLQSVTAKVGDTITLDMSNFTVNLTEGTGKDGKPCTYKVLRFVG